jgi:K+/H+ antiporter YhaU regulatory subunit KhtT
LLIVTLTILQNKKDASNNLPDKFSRKASSVGVDSLGTWITASLIEVCDSSSIQIIIQILKYSTTLSIDELCLSLIAKMVLLSADCAEQMLLPASHTKVQKKSTTINKQTEDMRTCISYVFSVAACNKNREVIVGAVADIVIGILLVYQKSENLISICETIARTTVIVLPLNKTKSTDSGVVDSRKTKEIEWAALKLLLKFIHRFQLFLAKLDERDYRNANEPSSQKVSILYAHKKVICATSLLIANSRAVAVAVNTLVGVEAIIKKSGKLVSPGTTEYNLIDECLVRLRMAREPELTNAAQGVIVVHLISCSDLYSDPDSNGLYICYYIYR